MSASEQDEPQERCLVVLDSLFKDAPNSSLSAIDSREDYEKRLASFSTLTYYAKPACLSPIVCARFGWKNVDRDMLQCSHCEAALAVSIHSSIVPSTLCQAYEPKLMATAHMQHCPFQLYGTKFVEQKEGATCILPAHLTLAFPDETLQLLQQTVLPPRVVFQRQCKHLQTLLGVSFDHSQIVVPDDILNYSPQEEEAPSSLLSRLAEILQMPHPAITVIALCLLGWSCKETGSSSVTTTLTCRVCRMEWQLRQNDDQPPEEPRASKRPRRSNHRNPLSSHRHYCPYVCGFPRAGETVRATPLWQIVANRLLEETTEDNHSIQHILRNAVSPKLRRK